MTNRPLKTPCVGLCSTVYGDKICRGCKRYDYEIIHWNSYTQEQQQTIWTRLNQLLTEVISPKLMITDAQLLKQKLVQHNIRFNSEQSPYYWVYLLLLKGSRQINNIEAYGIKRLSMIPKNLWDLREEIDVEYFELSEKHYPSSN